MGVQSDKIIGERAHGEGPGPEVMGASTLSGDSVVDRNGDSLGEIKEIMVDVPTGRVAYAVLSFGGFLGMGDKLFAVPWSASLRTPLAEVMFPLAAWISFFVAAT